MALSKKMNVRLSLASFRSLSLPKWAAAISSLLFLAACGGDSSSSKGTEPAEVSDSADIMADTFDDLPVCSDKREGTTAYVKDEKTVYICVDGDWTADSEDNESSSSEKDAASSSSRHCEEASEGCDEATSSSSTNKTNSSSSVSLNDSEGSSSSFVYEQNSSAYEQPEVVAVKDKSISGVSQKGPFVTGSAVKLYELDGKTYAQTGKSFTGKITTDDGKFSVSSVTLASQYALLEANGYFRNEITGGKSKGTVTLNALTDLSDRKTVNINLLTHLEYERALYLVGTGINVPSAKKQAEAEILNAFGIKGEFASSEDLNIFSKGDGNAALLAFSVLMLRDLSEADLTELLTKFATDIEKDGSWDDEATKAKIADWAQAEDLAGGLATIRSNIEKWNLGTVPEFEKYVRNFWYTNYGLGECGSSNKAEVLATKNERSATYGTQTRYICKDGAWVMATDYEKDFYKSGKANGEDGEFWTGLVTGKKYKYDEELGEWKVADDIDISLNNTCTIKREGSTDKDDEDNKFCCTANGWVSLMGGWSWDVPKEARLNPAITYGTMTDKRDKKVYKTVKIGDQTWMAENLNYADSAKTPSLLNRSWCYGNVAANCDVAGRLYTWAAAIDSVALYDGGNGVDCGYGKTCTLPAKVQGICPEGWHLPTYAEWNTLFTEVGGQLTAGKILKSQTGWYGNCNGSDGVGFSALPAGLRGSGGYFSSAGVSAYFRSASEIYASNMRLDYDGEYAGLGYYGEGAVLLDDSKSNGFSVRCLQD